MLTFVELRQTTEIFASFASVFPYSPSFPIIMDATDAKMQKIETRFQFFFAGQKVSKAVCKREVVFIFLRAKHFGLSVQ